MAKEQIAAGQPTTGHAAKRMFADLPPAKRRLLRAAAMVQLTLLAAALIDIRRRPGDQIRGPKRAWAAISGVGVLM